MAQPIQTYYNGYHFRSRSEARWAWAFDQLGIKYYYEPEGFSNNGIAYLPDFFLPDSKTWFEVKGVLGEEDEKKIDMFLRSIEDKYFVVGYPDMTFDVVNDWGEWFSTPDNSAISKCPICGKYYFLSDYGWYGCKNCGAYDGDHYLRTEAQGNLNHWYDGNAKNVLMKARSLRFEHGETP